MKLFNRWETEGIIVEDKSLAQVISFTPVRVPHTHGRHIKGSLKKGSVNVVERLVNKLMRGGTGEKTSGKVIRRGGQLQGKKLRLIKVVENAFVKIEEITKKNPLQVFVKALENAAPNEDITRVAYGGVSYQLAVDLSATRRLDMALRNIALSTILSSFNKKKKIDDALADEIIFTAQGDHQNSYSIKRKDEIERIAKSAR